MIRFIHTADVHFGVENYGKIDPKTGIHTRLLDFEQAFNACIDSAIEQKVDFFLFSGDAYKTPHPSQTQQRLLMRCFMRLYQAKIPAVIVVGNHDHPLSFGKTHALNIFRELPVDGFHVVDTPGLISLTTQHGPINIVGIPWPTRNTISMATPHLTRSAQEITELISRAVATIITDYANKLDPAVPAVLAGHLTVSNGIFSGSEKRAIYGRDPMLLPSQLAIPPFDYVALGHLHRYQNLNPNGYPAVVYSGSIERVDFGERNEEKGFCLVTIQEKGKTEHTFIKTPSRPFVQVDVTLNAGESQTEQVLAALGQETLDESVIKIIYRVPDGKRDAVDRKQLEAACARAHHIAGIYPVHAPPTRMSRAGVLKQKTDLKTLLELYFASKDTAKDRSSVLTEKALELMQKIEHEKQEGDENPPPSSKFDQKES